MFSYLFDTMESKSWRKFGICGLRRRKKKQIFQTLQQINGCKNLKNNRKSKRKVNLEGKYLYLILCYIKRNS